MDRAVVFKKARSIYDYDACYEWTTANMARPSDEHGHKGTWGCNGEFFWRAFSNGKDKFKSKYPNISQRIREWHAIEGSNSLYCYRAGPGLNLPEVPELQFSFVPCFCEASRLGAHHNCPNLGISGAPFFVTMVEKEGRRARVRTRAASAAAPAAEPDYESDASHTEHNPTRLSLAAFAE